MNITWKTGVNSHAMVLTGSPGFAGWSGGAGEWLGAGDAPPDAPGAPLAAQPATTRTTSTRIATWAIRAHGSRRTCESQAEGALADRVIAAPAPWMTPCDATHPHPAATEEPVLLDGLLRVA